MHARAASLLHTGHYEADRRQEALIEEIEKHMRAAVEVELRAWTALMAKHRIRVLEPGPEVVSSGTHLP